MNVHPTSGNFYCPSVIPFASSPIGGYCFYHEKNNAFNFNSPFLKACNIYAAHHVFLQFRSHSVSRHNTTTAFEENSLAYMTGFMNPKGYASEVKSLCSASQK